MTETLPKAVLHIVMYTAFGGAVMVNRTRGRNGGKKIGVKLIVAAIALVSVLALIDMQIRPIILKLSASKSRVAATEIINNAVYTELHSELFSYERLVKLTSNSDGEIMSIESDMYMINRLKTEVARLINEGLAELPNQDLSIPIGTATGIQLFYSRGPRIPIKAEPVGYVNTRLVSDFSAAGINQTHHRIILEVEVDMIAVIPGYTNTVQLKTDFIIAETVISGRVPDAFTEVLTADDGFIDEINDYGAENFTD